MLHESRGNGLHRRFLLALVEGRPLVDEILHEDLYFSHLHVVPYLERVTQNAARRPQTNPPKDVLVLAWTIEYAAPLRPRARVTHTTAALTYQFPRGHVNTESMGSTCVSRKVCSALE
jgi:hypothetical protein